MDKIRVTGGNRLSGKVRISGAKNAALPLMAACLLTEETLHLSNMPHLADISTMANLLINHGAALHLDGCCSEFGGHSGDVIDLCAKNINNLTAPYEIVKKMRASVLVLGPLLARFSEAKVSLPGGCAIGTRPIDLHLSALEKMGAQIDLSDGYIIAKVDGKLKGAEIEFAKVSVGATENLIMAATLADGVTTLKNAAIEPEVTDLAELLVKMGAKIEGVGTTELKITGVDKLNGADHSVVSDRIEAGTYMLAAAITGGDVEVTKIRADIMGSTIDKLRQANIDVEITSDTSIKVSAIGKDLKAFDAITVPYPGFATDMQAQFMALACFAGGESRIVEDIFENRFMHVSELCRMGANIMVSGKEAIIKGSKQLKGAEIMATDLRASVSLVIAALAAEGQTTISRMYHIDRGYERIEEKLAGIGAKIERIRG